MTNVVRALPNEEKDAWLNLNDIRQNAKKHNWQESPGKRNHYIFSKDNVKICIIGLKGLVTIDIQLLSGVNYKLCKSNLKKEEIYDLFSTNSFFNYTNDVLQKTVLCNSYDLTVKEKIDLFNKNDKSFLQEVKCKDLFFPNPRESHRLGNEKAKMGTTKVEISAIRSSAAGEQRQGKQNSTDFPEEKKVQMKPIESTQTELQAEEGKQLQKENAHIRSSLYQNAFTVSALSKSVNNSVNKAVSKAVNKAVNKAVLSKEQDKDEKRFLKKFILFNKGFCDKDNENLKGCSMEGGANSPFGEDPPCGNDHSGGHPKVKGQQGGEIFPRGSSNQKGEKNCRNYGVKKGYVEGEQNSPPHIVSNHTSEIEEAEKLNVGNSDVSRQMDTNKYGSNKTKERKPNRNGKNVNGKNVNGKNMNGKNMNGKNMNGNEWQLALSPGRENSMFTAQNDTFGKFNSDEKYSLRYGSTRGNSKECLEWCDTLSTKRECHMLKSFITHSLSEEDINNETLHRMNTSGEGTANSCSGEGNTNEMNNDPPNGPPLHTVKTNETDLAPNSKGRQWCVRELPRSHSDCTSSDNVVDRERHTNGHLLQNVTDEEGSPIDCNQGHQLCNRCIHKTKAVNIYIQNNTVQYFGPKYRHNRKVKARWARGEEGLSHLKDYRRGYKSFSKWGSKWDNKWSNRWINLWDNHHWDKWGNWNYRRDYRWNNWNVKYNHYSEPGKRSLVKGHSLSPRIAPHLALQTRGKENYTDKNNAYYSPSWTKRTRKYYTTDSCKVYNNGRGQRVDLQKEAACIYTGERRKNGISDYPFWNVQKSKDVHQFYGKRGFCITKNRKNYTLRKYNERRANDALQPYEPHKNVKEMEKEIYYKLSYLKHFKHDYTKSIPRYYCNLRHLLAPSRTRKLPLWIQNMISTNKCGYCDEQFSSLRNLENHFLHVKTHRIYYCCGKPFTCLKFLHIHLRRDNHYGYIYYY
ncbi:conserved Plasmodium protein, unknown function [Plasmodium knowlesi strain H]|uniref:Uncharacterized protein n=3 Tax=Plasmodium knowlesi TaxID=5850 RepID=A0A5K1V5Q9_PLAKH|nr:conserved Plasmodium protein, unknown function [Plasmodium knowlesi strain H]OTN66628.1 Uncharacterized protein PKNOH_S08480500 [Plasmodium knowlesi]CAA9990129.1 conserved Plasmodium protein, unknown function [Plasmodium knowlesi strain H]SBO25812.1 conserved Plasmodium protein, unknown function [Plasmodium knowlesi strain H]SBO28602.1 conserved Plasmodium protein, unknown function [Plasmodium knowlesi strain H]VVS79603.1 conserved Plasmodium protein, unknown function [Plasmodium knowlesi s|eukprot:XP_002260596.1 hypothetical protein, conserved in Plasmodium species [Plasmodium knowlesi strain H]